MPQPTIKVTVTSNMGVAPFTVTATAEIDNATTWRWLLDDAIHQPIDGLTHTFTLQGGVHKIAVRAVGGDGTVVVSDPVLLAAYPETVREVRIEVPVEKVVETEKLIEVVRTVYIHTNPKKSLVQKFLALIHLWN